MKTLNYKIISFIFIPVSLFWFLYNHNKDVHNKQSYTVRHFNPALNGNKNFSNIYSDLEYVSLDFLDDAVTNVVTTGNKIFVSHFANNNLLSIYNKDGTLVNQISSIPSVQLITPVGFKVDTKNEYIYIGDTHQKSILIYSFDGEFIDKLEVGMHFSAFNYSSENQHFILYVPMPYSGVDLEGNAIVVLNKNLEIVSKSFPLHNLCNEFNPLSSNRFQTNGSRTFFNPPLSGTIYELYYDGTHRKIFDLPVNHIKSIEVSIEDILKRSSDIKSVARHVDRILPIKSFLVHEDQILVESYFEKYPHFILYDKGTDRYIVSGARVLIENFGDKFDFVFSRPRYISDGKFISFYSSENCAYFYDALKNLNSPDKLLRLSETVSKNKGLLMVYEYDFDFLFENSNEDLSYLLSPPSNDFRINSIHDLNIFPNPATTNVRLQFKGLGEQMKIQLIALNGVVAKELTVNALNGDYTQNIDIHDLSSGIYFLKIISPNGGVVVEQLKIAK